ncbi:MAG: beta-ketoacyl synthase N-terminal-like domain-containing protein [Sulfurovum sp.]
MHIKNKVFITHTSSSSCAGEDNKILFENICQGKSGIKQDTKYFYESAPAIGKFTTPQNLEIRLKQQIEDILAQSQLKDFTKTLLIVGSSVGGMSLSEEIFFEKKSYDSINPKLHAIDTIATLLRKHFDFYDDISFSTACTSSANALGYAYEVLSKGLYENALVIGADTLCQTTVGGFLTLGVLSSNPCRPFDKERDGMNVSEAIASLLLQTKASSNAVELCGVGYSSDAYHMTPMPMN